MYKALAVLLLATVASAAQTFYLSDSDKSVQWNFGNGLQSTLTLSCNVHGFDLTLDSPASTTSTVQFISPSNTCSSNLVCQGTESTGSNVEESIVNPGDYEDETFELTRATPGSAKCVTGKVEASYESCMGTPVKKDTGIEYEAEVLIKQSHAITTIAPCQLDHQTIVKLKCCVTPPETSFIPPPPTLKHDLKACEKADFNITGEAQQSGHEDHISWIVFSKDIAWANHDHVGYFVHSCTGSAGGKTIDLFHHETSNIVAGKTQNCDMPDLSVAFGEPEPSRPDYFYVFDMPFVLPAGINVTLYDTLDIDCKVRFCNKGADKLFAADCPVYSNSIVDAINAPQPTCSRVYTEAKGVMGAANVFVDQSF